MFFCRLIEEGALMLFEQRDIQSLYRVRMKAINSNERALVAKVESYIDQLQEKR